MRYTGQMRHVAVSGNTAYAKEAVHVITISIIAQRLRGRSRKRRDRISQIFIREPLLRPHLRDSE